MASAGALERVSKAIGVYTDFPKKGIVFRDIFSVLGNPSVNEDLNALLLEAVESLCPDVEAVVGLEARGFLFGPLIARELKIPFVPIRKKGKLPGDVQSIAFDLEYGSDTFEVQNNVLKSGTKILIVDDLLATGGTMKAACDLMTKVGVEVSLCLVIIELSDLKGKDKITKPFKSLIGYSD